MDWFNELTAKLPRRNDAEPPGLREQIVAELRDHLECDFRREMITAENEQAAWQRVRTKFGNPAEVALRLWLDAMKGKLLMQKLSLAFLTALVCLCLVMIGFMWNNFSAQADMQRESLDEISEQFKSQIDRLIEQIPKMQTEQMPVVVPESGDWREFSLTLEVEGKAPAKSFSVSINHNDNKVRQSAQMKAGQTHDFGSLPPGNYHVTIFSPWGETYHSEILIGPGRENKLVVHAPAIRPDFTEIGFRFTFPDNFKLTEKDRLLLLASGVPRNRTIGADHWGLSAGKVIITLDWQGKVIDCKKQKGFFGLDSLGYFTVPEITAVGNINFQNGYFSIESFCFAKLVKGEIDSGEYHYSSTYYLNLTERDYSVYTASSGERLQLIPVYQRDQNGKPFPKESTISYDDLSGIVYEIYFNEQFAEWYQKKDHFSATCDFFINTPQVQGGGGGGGGGFF